MRWKEVIISLVVSFIVSLASFGWLFAIAFGSGDILTPDKFLKIASEFASRGEIGGLIFLTGSFLVIIPVLLAVFLLESLGLSFASSTIPVVILTTAVIIFLLLCAFFFVKNRIK